MTGLDRFSRTLLFLTRIPWKTRKNASPFGVYPEQLPLVGAIIGGILAGFWVLFSHLPPLVAGTLLTGVWMILTGGLHLDGWADTWESALSARTIEEKTRIRKDPHVGIYAVLALVFILMFKVACLFSWHYLTNAIVAIPLLARGLLPLSMKMLLYFSPKTVLSPGLGETVQTSFRGGPLWVGLVLSTLAGVLLLGLSGALFIAAGWVIWVFLALWVLERSDSLSGDMMGWSVEALEGAFLLALGVNSVVDQGS